MKKIYVLIAAGFVCAQTSNAQITLLRAYHEPRIGHVADMIQYDSIGTIPRNTGQGTSWDFSNMQISTTKTMQTYVDPTTVSSASLFPGSNIAGALGNNSHIFYRIDSTSNPAKFEMLGVVSGTGSAVWSDPKTLMEWPVSFGKTWTDNYGSSSPLAVTGGYTASATGVGDLQIVGRSFQNALQISTWDSTRVNLGPNVTRSFTRGYTYYDDTQRYPILIFYRSTIQTDNMTPIESYGIWVNYLEAVGLTDNNFDSQYSVYPNPATNKVQVKLSNNSSYPATLTIQNLTGQVVKSFDLGTGNINAELEVNDLPKGVYLVRTTVADKTGSRKLIID